MPRLNHITIADFRNISLAELDFSPNVNCIVGGNGEGKTNLLDAIHYLSVAKSFLGLQDRYNIRYGCEAFSLCGHYTLESGLGTKIALRAGVAEKTLRRDDKPLKKLSSHIGLLPIVTVSPADGALVSEAGEERRRFANLVLAQTDAPYLAALQQYNKLLQQRNRLLKEDHPDEGLLEVLDVQMDACAAPIFEKRQELATLLSPVVAGYYARLSDGKENVQIRYRSDLQHGSLKELLERSRIRDLMLHYTGCGIQRDDFSFEMGGEPIRRCGSQGQQKTFLVALKFAQYELMKHRCSLPPTLLLDDVFDKLDLERTGRLIAMVAKEDFGQIFITDCNKSRLQPLVEEATADSAWFQAEGGRFTAL
ncbi:MAG: DNA replication and repair protein RecF [Bacteroidales bacterium]|nr:DNA replication and repair protein RecF [Bacteroidales bacterium]